MTAAYHHTGVFFNKESYDRIRSLLVFSSEFLHFRRTEFSTQQTLKMGLVNTGITSTPCVQLNILIYIYKIYYIKIAKIKVEMLREQSRNVARTKSKCFENKVEITLFS